MPTRKHVKVRIFRDKFAREVDRTVVNTGKTYQNIGRREAARRLKQRTRRCNV